MSEKKVLVTGGAGFIGSHLAERLAGNHEVRVLDLDECEVEGVESVVGDILDEKTVKKALKDIDAVYHLAAQISVPTSLENPEKDCEINVIGTINLLKHCNQIEKFVYGSTSSIYGPAQYSPADEAHPINPVTPYALSKLCAEKYSQLFSKIKDFEVAVARLSSPYGPRCRNVIALFFERAMQGKDLKIFGEGTQKRAYLYIEDVVNAYATLLEKGSGIYNIGHREEVSMNEIAEKIIEVTNSESQIIHEEAREGEEDLPTLDTIKAREELNWEPKTSFEEGIQKMYQAIKED